MLGMEVVSMTRERLRNLSASQLHFSWILSSVSTSPDRSLLRALGGRVWKDRCPTPNTWKHGPGRRIRLHSPGHGVLSRGKPSPLEVNPKSRHDQQSSRRHSSGVQHKVNMSILDGDQGSNYPSSRPGLRRRGTALRPAYGRLLPGSQRSVLASCDMIRAEARSSLS